MRMILGNCPAIGRDDICTVGLDKKYCANKECEIKQAIRELRHVNTILDVVEVDDDEV